MNAAWRYLKERLQSLTHQSSTLVLVSLAHGINHAQSALKPLIYPIVLREFNVGYGELGVMLGIASALGGLLQLAAGALGTVVRRNLLLGWGNVAVGISVMIIALAQNFAQFFLWNVAARVGGAAQHPVGSSLIAHHFHRERLGLALATHFSAGNVGTALIPLVAAVLISLWGWRITTALFAIPAILVGLAICAWLNDPRLSHEHAPETHNHSFWRHGWEATANPRLRWILVASIAAAGGSGHGTISVYIPLYLTDALGMESSAVGFVFSLLMAGSIVGPLLGGRLVDRFNCQRVVQRLCHSGGGDRWVSLGRRPDPASAHCRLPARNDQLRCNSDPPDIHCAGDRRSYARFCLRPFLYCCLHGGRHLVSGHRIHRRRCGAWSGLRRHGRLFHFGRALSTCCKAR